MKFIPPLTLPWSWHVESGHCYKLARPSPTKHYIRSTLELTWHLESWFKCHFLSLQQNNTLNKLRQFILSHFWKLRPPDPTQQHIKHVKKIGILSHFVDFVAVFLKALRSTYEPTWHPESCSKSILYSSKINTLNIRMNKVEMLICLETFHPPPFPIHTLCQNVPCLVKMFLAFPCNKTIRWTHGKKGILSHFWNLQSLDPTKQYVKKTVKVDTSSFFYGESWHVELFLKFSPPSTLQSKRLNKCRKLTCGVIFAIYNLSSTPQNTKQYLYVPVIYEQSWHVESLFWSLNVLPPSPPIPFKTLRSTYQPIWNLESLLCFFPAVPYQNTTFNI